MNDEPAKRNVTAIIVTYFTGPLLARSVASVRAQPDVAEIIIVDNGNWPGAVAQAVEGVVDGSSDGVVDGTSAAAEAPTVEPDGPTLRVLTGHGNIGFSKACNIGAMQARGTFLFFINPDAVAPAGGVRRLLNDARGLTDPWLMAPKLVDPDGAEQQGSRRATLTPWRAIVEATKLYRLAPQHPYFRRFNLHTEKCPTDVTPLPVISGACFMLPKTAYAKIGGMDERYFLHVEDVDFCLRFTEAGGGIFFNPHVSVTHYKSSSRVDPLRIEMRKTASMLLYFRQHFSSAYPAPFLWFVHGMLWMRFGVKSAFRLIFRTIGFAGLVLRYGPNGARRIHDMRAQRATR